MERKGVSMETVSIGISEGYNTKEEGNGISHKERRYLISRTASMMYKIYSFHPHTPQNERMYWMKEKIPELEEWRKTVSWAHSKQMNFVWGLQPPNEESFGEVSAIAKKMANFCYSMRKLPDGTNTRYFQVAITLDDCEDENITRKYFRKVEELIIVLVTKFKLQVYGYFPKDYRCEKRLYHSHSSSSSEVSSPISKTPTSPQTPQSPSTEYQVTEEWRKRGKYNMFRFLPGGVGLIYCSVDINVNNQNPIRFSAFWSATQVRRLSRIFNRRKMICFDNHPCSKRFFLNLNKKKEEDKEEQEGEIDDDEEEEEEGYSIEEIKKNLIQVLCHRKKEFRVLLRSKIDFDFWINLRYSLDRIGDILWILKIFQLVVDFGGSSSHSSSTFSNEYPETKEQLEEIFKISDLERNKYNKLFPK